jgi:hypothetical protein
LTQISKLNIRKSPPSAEGEESLGGGLWDQLEANGWDLQSRLFLGFDSKRVVWSVIENDGDDEKETTHKTTTTKKNTKKGSQKKSQ